MIRRLLCVTALTAFAMGSMAANSYAADDVRVLVKAKAGHHGNMKSMAKSAGWKIHHDLDRIDTIAITVPAKALNGLRNNPNVEYVEEDVRRYPSSQTTPWGIDQVQARSVWDPDLDGQIDAGAATGAGIMVCIIDSGLYVGHEDMAEVDIIGGYPAGWNSDLCGHGTHVAGTITAANNGLGVVGVSPGKASLYIFKVFGDDCGWAYSSTLASAAYHCADQGADVISMSLGGTRSNRTEQKAFDALYGQGILSIAAAGNDGNTAMSYPASYDSVVSVAATDSDNVVADFSQQNSAVEISAPGVNVLSTVPFNSTNDLTVDGVVYDAEHIDFAGMGSAAGALVDGGLCDGTGSWSGQVVLCERGEISFYDKYMNVLNSGGNAAIIYNNLPGNFLGTLGETVSSDMIALSLSQEDGQYLVANKLGVNADLYSNTVVPASGYESWNGTSMATPHVSGVAAVLWSSNPSLTNDDIRNAMTATALDLGATGRDNAYGFGLVQAKDALDSLGSGPVEPECTVDGDCATGICCFESCVLPTCSADNECDDGDECTIDTCTNANTCGAQCESIFSDVLCPGPDPDDPFCGDGTCDGANFGETCKTCSADCPKIRGSCCGDLVCGKFESETTCPIDCL